MSYNMNMAVQAIYANARKTAIDNNSQYVYPAHLTLALTSDSTFLSGLKKAGCDFIAEEVRVESERALGNIATADSILNELWASAGVPRNITNAKSVEVINEIIVSNFTPKIPDIIAKGTKREIRVSHLMLGLLVSPAQTSNPLQVVSARHMRQNDQFINAMMNGVLSVESHNYGEPEGLYVFPIKLKGAESSHTAVHSEPQENAQNSEDENPFLTDMLTLAKTDDKPFIGRESELESLINCIERKDKPNAILVGAPGVGKTDIVRGLAQKIINKDVPPHLQNVQLFMMDIPGMLAGAQFRGQFEERLKSTIESLMEMDRPLVFIDEIHTVLGAGASASGSMDAANILKPYLTQGKLRVIGATTSDEYRKHVENDAAFMRRFQSINVSEPTPKDTIAILKGSKVAYEKFHKVKVPVNAVELAVNLSVKHMHDRFLPDKAIDILDQTCARVKNKGEKKVTTNDIYDTVSKLCNIPKQSMEKSELDKVRTLDSKLKSQVFGQDEAIARVTEAIQQAKLGLNDETKPIGNFLFVGPSGVGKTEIAKQLASNMGIDFLRFDMSEYMEAHSAAKLIGAPAGYVGYEDGGLLIEQVRNHPHSVLLFDEIEKAHPSVFDVFLQMLDNGMMKDNRGRVADFRNTVIIMTSNAGNTNPTPKVGFNQTNEACRANSIDALKKIMRPELIGRLSEGNIIQFNKLGNDVANLIVKKELKALTARMKAQGYTVTYSDDAIAEIVKRGVSAKYGAREIQNVINRDIKSLFTKRIISGTLPTKCCVGVDNGNFVCTEPTVIDIPAIESTMV